jgi:hypothetical protein
MLFFKLLHSVWPALPLILLIPVVKNDFVLTAIYIVVAFLYMLGHRMKHDWLVYTIGVFSITIFQSIFIMTGVETFNRATLFGIMPLWLPFLWAFAFLLMRRGIKVIDNYK